MEREREAADDLRTGIATTRIGFVGLGSQGGPMAEMILAAGLPLTIWARKPAVVDRFRAAGAIAAPDLVTLGRSVDVVGVCVVDDRDVDEVCTPLLVGLAPRTTITVHSTVLPDTVQRLEQRAGDHGVSVLDAPVMGGGDAARARRLAVAVGGRPDVVERCRPMLECYGNPIAVVGPVGAGQVMKLLYNLLFVANAELLDRTVAVAARLGLDQGATVDLIDQLRASTFSARLLRRAMSADALGHADIMLTKDVTFARQVLDHADVDLEAVVSLALAGLETVRRLATEAP